MGDEEETRVRTSDEFVEDVRELRRLEEEKRTVPVGSRRFRELAEAIVRKSREIMQRAILQGDVGDRDDTDPRSINDIRDDLGDGRS